MADALDLLTPDEAYQAINVDPGSVGHDEDLATFTTAVSRRIDERCGAVVQRTVTDEPYDGGRYFIPLPWATAAVTEVKEYTGSTLANLAAENIAAPTSTNWVFDKRTGLLYRRSGGLDYPFAYGRSNVLVTYTWGRFTNTASVDEKFKTAAKLMLNDWWQASAKWWERHSQFASDDLGMPPLPPRAAQRITEVLGDELRPPVCA